MANIVQSLALGFEERAWALGLKGKARDRAALDYFVGAAAALRFMSQDHSLTEHARGIALARAEHVERWACMVLTVRGFSEVKLVADRIHADRKTRQYQEGVAAFQADSSVNPYPEASDEGRAWRLGWEEACEGHPQPIA